MTLFDQFRNYEPHLVSEAASYTATSGGGGALSGSGVPDNSLGANGQLYVDTGTGTIYSKANDVWSVASGGSSGITSGNGSPVGVIDPATYVIYVQLDSDPPFQQWNSDGANWH